MNREQRILLACVVFEFVAALVGIAFGWYLFAGIMLGSGIAHSFWAHALWKRFN